MLVKDECKEEFNRLDKLFEAVNELTDTDEEVAFVNDLRSLVDKMGSTETDKVREAAPELADEYVNLLQRKADLFDPSEEALEALIVLQIKSEVSDLKDSGVSADSCYKILSSKAVRAALESREDAIRFGIPDDALEELQARNERNTKFIKKEARKAIKEIYGVRVGKKKKRRK